MKARGFAVLVACLLALAGCGSQHQKLSPARCPAGHSFMGCAAGVAAVPAPPKPGTRTLTAPVSGCVFPDVSSYQGHPDWGTAQAHICAAVAKAGEGFNEDQDFASNVSAFRSLHIPWAPYWFIRSCDEGSTYASVLGRIGYRGDRLALRPVLDMEVPAAFNCAVPLANAIHAALGVWPVIYTAPGIWPGGSSGGLPVWEADFTLGRLEALPFTAHVIAWQRYSPPYTFLYVSGLGYTDENLNLGFATDYAYPAPPAPKCWQLRQIDKGFCERKGNHGWRVDEIAFQLRAIGWLPGSDHRRWFDALMARALSGFQAHHGVKPSYGFAGRRTLGDLAQTYRFNTTHGRHLLDTRRPV